MNKIITKQIHNKNSFINIKHAPFTETSNSETTPSIEERVKQYFTKSHIGCDETGSADFFGPLCVVACYIDERDFDWLVSIGIKDPKEYSDQEIVDTAKEIKDRMIYSLLILDNSHYNQMASEGNNLANIKAKLYNQAVTNVMQKVQMTVKTKVINQFVSPKTYYNYLKSEVIVVKDLAFEQKGEENYLGIMCANILSRYAYLQYFSNMSKSLKIKLPRGTATSVEHIAVDIANKYGEKMLTKVTKTNMTNFKRVKETLNK